MTTRQWVVPALLAGLAGLLSGCGGGGGGGVADLPAQVQAPVPERVPEEAPAPGPEVGVIERITEGLGSASPVAPGESPPASPPQQAPDGTGEPVLSLDAAGKKAATSELRIGSLHLSSAPGIPVVASGFTMEPPERPGDDFIPFNETYRMDYDGDGEPERRLTVADDSYQGINMYCNGNRDGGGYCQAYVGDADKYFLYVLREWERAGYVGNSQRHEVTWGTWYDREAGHVGQFWYGPTVDEPRPLANPIRGSAWINVGGIGVLPDGDDKLVNVGAPGLMTFDLQETTVTMEVGRPQTWGPHRAAKVLGINLTGAFPNTNRGRAVRHISKVFVFKENYSTNSPYFGVGEGQLSRLNDVVSGNGRGQFGGVITTVPGGWNGDAVEPPATQPASASKVKGAIPFPRFGAWSHPAVPAVYGSAGLTDIEGHEGISLLMTFHGVFPAALNPPEE